MRCSAYLFCGAALAVGAAGCGGHRSGVSVPSVVGLREPVAVKQMVEAGFATEITRRRSKGPKNVVIAQSPSAGERAKTGAKVQLVVRIAAG
jgi:beta-lactam-binding protein with PASTA domain